MDYVFNLFTEKQHVFLQSRILLFIMMLHISGGTSRSEHSAVFSRHLLLVRDAETTSLVGWDVEAQKDQAPVKALVDQVGQRLGLCSAALGCSPLVL